MLLQRGDVAPTGSARRRAPPSAEPASCATAAFPHKQRLGGAVPDADEGARDSGVSSVATNLPGRQRREGKRIAFEEKRESRPDVNGAGCRGEDEEGEVRQNSAI